MAKRRGRREAAVVATHRPAPARGVIARAAIIVVLGTVGYLPAASSPFLLDDQTSILNNPTIRSLTPLSAALSPPRDTPVAGRPLVNLSFALNYANSGVNPRGYRLTNLAIHLLAALALFGVFRRALLAGSVPAPLAAHAINVAFAGALLWALHPLNSEVVDYVTQRSESLMGLCYLLTVYAALRALPSRESPRVAEAGRRWPVVAALACTAGMLCKESMVTAPIAVLLIDRLLVFDSWREAFRVRGRLYAALAVSWLVLAVVLLSAPRTSAGFGSTSAGVGAGVTAWVYLLNQAQIVARYLWLAVWPHALVVDYGLPQPLALSDVFLPGALVIGLVIVGGLLLAFRPKIGLLAALFFLTLAPTSSIVPVATEVGAERRMYLPLAALVALAVFGCAWLVYARGREDDAKVTAASAGYALPGALVVIVALMIAGTISRGQEYASQLTMAHSIVDRWPNGRGRFMLGTALIEAGQEEAGMAELRLSARDYPGALFAIGTELVVAGKFDEGIEALQRFLQALPNHVNAVPARELLGRAYAGKGDLVAARAELQTLVRQAPGYVTGHDLLGRILASQGDFAGAAVEFEKVVTLAPGNAEARRNLQSVRQLAIRQ